MTHHLPPALVAELEARDRITNEAEFEAFRTRITEYAEALRAEGFTVTVELEAEALEDARNEAAK